MTSSIRDPALLAERIHISGLNSAIEDDKLKQRFSKYGNIKEFERSSTCKAFIQYDNSTSVANAIKKENGSTIELQKIVVSHAIMKVQRLGDINNQDASCVNHCEIIVFDEKLM